MKAKRILLAPLLAIATSCLLGFGVISAGAEAADSVAETFCFKEGASIRLSDPTGLRFTVKMGEEEYVGLVENGAYKDGKTLKVYVAPQVYFEKFALTEVIGKAVYAEIKADTIYTEKDAPGFYFANAVLKGIKYQHTGLKYQAVAAIESAAGESVYSEVSDARSVSYVASAALANNDKEEDWTEEKGAVADGFVQKAIAWAKGVEDYVEGNYTVEATLNESELLLAPQEQEKLTLSVTPAVDLYAKWTSDNEDVAVVDENGNVTAVAPGTANITASVFGKQVVCGVTVSYSVTAVNSVTGKSEVYYVSDGQSAADVVPIPSADGYTFDGWCSDGQCTRFIDLSAVSENVTVYAKFMKGNVINSFNSAEKAGSSSVDTMPWNFAWNITERISVDSGTLYKSKAEIDATIAEGMSEGSLGMLHIIRDGFVGNVEDTWKYGRTVFMRHDLLPEPESYAAISLHVYVDTFDGGSAEWSTFKGEFSKTYKRQLAEGWHTLYITADENAQMNVESGYFCIGNFNANTKNLYIDAVYYHTEEPMQNAVNTFENAGSVNNTMAYLWTVTGYPQWKEYNGDKHYRFVSKENLPAEVAEGMSNTSQGVIKGIPEYFNDWPESTGGQKFLGGLMLDFKNVPEDYDTITIRAYLVPKENLADWQIERRGWRLWYTSDEDKFIDKTDVPMNTWTDITLTKEEVQLMHYDGTLYGIGTPNEIVEVYIDYVSWQKA